MKNARRDKDRFLNIEISHTLLDIAFLLIAVCTFFWVGPEIFVRGMMRIHPVDGFFILLVFYLFRRLINKLIDVGCKFYYRDKDRKAKPKQ